MEHSEQIEHKMREFFGQLASEADTYHAALLDVPHAVQQLSQSAHGIVALRGFAQFCRAEGAALNSAEWKALSTLCLASGYMPPARYCFNYVAEEK